MKNEIINLYKEQKTVTEITSILNIHRSTVSRALTEANIKRRPSNKYSANFEYFEKIDSPKKAYWLGFIAADGYLMQGKGLELSQAEKDSKIRKEFKKDIESTHPIKIYSYDRKNRNTQPSHRIVLYSRKLANDLVKWGIPEKNKTYTLTFPPPIEKHLLNYFLLGFFEGDGSKDSRGRVSICGLDSYMKEIGLFLKKEINVRSKFYYRKEKFGSLVFWSSDKFKLAEYLYKINEDVHILNRKDFRQPLHENAIENRVKTGKAETPIPSEASKDALEESLETSGVDTLPLSCNTTLAPDFPAFIDGEDDIVQTNKKKIIGI